MGVKSLCQKDTFLKLAAHIKAELSGWLKEDKQSLAAHQ